MTDHEGQLKCLSFQEPYATLIVLGHKTIECRTRSIQTPIKDLVVCASKTASAYYPIDGLAYGFAIGLVDVVDREPFTKGHREAAMMSRMPDKKSNAWKLENARLIKPFPVKATASFFYVEHEIEVLSTNRQAYFEHYSDIIVNDDNLATESIEAFFGDLGELWEMFAL
ncbi:ASCH domain-containing protein [Gordonibacter sp.]|uniref:ASCH domain-containing protein n=1 Tax=Gordonibacter sp. TaxID=1968902 RepID=UPI002FC9BC9E